MSINEIKTKGFEKFELKKIDGIQQIQALYQGFIVDLWGWYMMVLVHTQVQ